MMNGAFPDVVVSELDLIATDDTVVERTIHHRLTDHRRVRLARTIGMHEGHLRHYRVSKSEVRAA